MLLNNLDAEVAERPEELVVYGGSGKAARNHEALRALVRSLLTLGDDETLLVQSGKPVGVFRTQPGGAARPDRQLAARPALGDLGRVPPARGAGADDVRPDDGRELDLHRHARGSCRAPTRRSSPPARSTSVPPTWPRRRILTAGLAGIGGAQPLAATLAGTAVLCVEVDPGRVRAAAETRYLDQAADSLDDALGRVRAAAREGRALSVGLSATRPFSPELAGGGEAFDLVTDETAAHDPLTATAGRATVEEAAALRERDPEAYVRRARESIVLHVQAMMEFVRAGESCLRPRQRFPGGGSRRRADGRLLTIRASSRLTSGRFLPRNRAVPMGGAFGRPGRHRRHRRGAARAVPGRRAPPRWLSSAGARRFQGLPARICWLGFGDRARAGLAINELVRSGGVGPGRDRPRSSRFRLGRFAVPRDRGHAGRLGRIADWPILNALLNSPPARPG